LQTKRAWPITKPARVQKYTGTTELHIIIIIIIIIISGKEVKIQAFMYRDITNVEPEMYDYTNNNWSH